MGASWEMNNRFKEIHAELIRAEQALTTALVRRGAAIAQESAPRDTGFYADNIHALAPGSSGLGAVVDVVGDSRGRTVIRRASAVGAPGNRGAIVAAASYSIQVELLHGTLNRAVEALRGEFPGIAASLGAVAVR